MGAGDQVRSQTRSSTSMWRSSSDVLSSEGLRPDLITHLQTPAPKRRVTPFDGYQQQTDNPFWNINIIFT